MSSSVAGHFYVQETKASVGDNHLETAIFPLILTKKYIYMFSSLKFLHLLMNIKPKKK